MGGLAHYIEEEGVATTQISLIREHTEIIRPPRALWVPFELGRPFGAPNNPNFQSSVLVAALTLLSAERGPVLAEFAEDAPAGEHRTGPVACPVSFDNAAEDLGQTDVLLKAFRQEVAQFENWYDLAAERRGRTTAGVTGLTPGETADYLAAFVHGKRDMAPLAGVSFAAVLRMAAEDLKAYYMEAVTAQPGQPTDGSALAEWFWSRTIAARVLNEIRIICLDISDDEYQLLGKVLLVPRTQLHNFETKF